MASIYDWSRTAADNDDADSGVNWLEGQPPSTVNNSSRTMMARQAEFLADLGCTQTTGGSANAQTITARSSFTALATGLIVGFKAGFSNTGAATLNVNSLGAKAIRKGGDEALVANDIVAGGLYVVMYDAAANSAAGAWLLVNSVSSDVGVWTLVDTWNHSTNVSGVAFTDLGDYRDICVVMDGVTTDIATHRFFDVSADNGSSYAASNIFSIAGTGITQSALRLSESTISARAGSVTIEGWNSTLNPRPIRGASADTTVSASAQFVTGMHTSSAHDALRIRTETTEVFTAGSIYILGKF